MLNTKFSSWPSFSEEEADSVVTKSVKPGDIVFGNPAKSIKDRRG